MYPLPLKHAHETPPVIAQAAQSTARAATARSRNTHPVAAPVIALDAGSDGPAQQRTAIDDRARMHTPVAAVSTANTRSRETKPHHREAEEAVMTAPWRWQSVPSSRSKCRRMGADSQPPSPVSHETATAGSPSPSLSRARICTRKRAAPLPRLLVHPPCANALCALEPTPRLSSGGRE